MHSVVPDADISQLSVHCMGSRWYGLEGCDSDLDFCARVSWWAALLGMFGSCGREVLDRPADAGIVLDVFADAGSPCSRCVPEAVAVPDGLAEARVVSDTVADAASITLYSSSFIYHLYSIVYNPSILRHLPFQIPSSIIHR